MFHFSKLRIDIDGRVVAVDVIRQTTEYRDRKLVQIHEVLETHETLGAAAARVRALNEETAL